MSRDELTGERRRLRNLGAILLGASGLTGLVLLGTGTLDGYAQGIWGVSMLVSVLLLVYAGE